MARGTRRAAFAALFCTSIGFAAPAQAAAELSSYPSSASFYSVQVSTMSGTTVMSINNYSGDAAVISSVSMVGPDASQFEVDDGCTGRTVGGPPSYPSCSLGVRFAPTSAGSKMASVRVTPSDGFALSIPVDGTGTLPSLATYPSSITFGSYEVGTRSVDASISVQNNGMGNGPVHIDQVSILGGGGQFELVDDDCSNQDLAGFSQCAILVAFTPASAGDQNASVRFTSSATQSPHVVSLSGVGSTSVSAYPSSIDFGQQGVGTLGYPTEIHVSSFSANEYEVTDVSLGGSHPGDFVLTDGCTGRTIGGFSYQCTIGAAFQPTAGGSRNATISIETTAPGGPLNISLVGSGVAPLLRLSPTSVSFGNVELGETGQRTVTVRNDGFGTAILDATSIGGPGAELFGTDGACEAAYLPPQSSCSFTVGFSPDVAGSTSAALTVTAPGSQASVTLSGTGVDTTPPSSNFDESPVPLYVRVSSLHSITGTTFDLGGVASVRLTFTDALGSRTNVTAVLDQCTLGNRTCAWSALVPLLVPGPYVVGAGGTDVKGNPESSGPDIDVIII